MSFVAHTETEIASMLSDIGCKTIDDLFSEIPSNLKIAGIADFPQRMTEMQVWQLLQQRAQLDATNLNFIGAGAYEHYIPAVVWELAGRGEFLTAYTPYQAEASQGTLQVLYEYQSMMALLTGMQVCNASLYDGATAVAEAILMAMRCAKNSSSKKILLPTSVNPLYRQVIATIVKQQNIEIIDIPYSKHTGRIEINDLANLATAEYVALVIPQPNFFGILEDINTLTDWAHKNKMLVIAQVNPMSLGLLQAPGSWGSQGADIVCGEAQPFGIPLSSGGPYIGFICCRREFIRQLPGRLVAMTVDASGKRGFTLTLQPREQHIRRAKATSNICTNQGLMATAVTIYLSLMGAAGLKQVALQSHNNTLKLKQALEQNSTIKILFNTPFFHEIVLQFDRPVQPILDQLAAQGIQAGFNISQIYPELGNAILCCVTETKTETDINSFVQALQQC